MLRRILPSYLGHLRAGNFDTLLPHFLGLFTIHLEGHSPVHLVAVNNVYFTFAAPGSSAGHTATSELSERYELTGASRGRYVPPEAYPLVLKDHNFSALGLTPEGQGEYPYPVMQRQIRLGAAIRRTLLQQLERDCAWLESENLVNYSLLVGVIGGNSDPAPAPGPFEQGLQAEGAPLRGQGSWRGNGYDAVASAGGGDDEGKDGNIVWVASSGSPADDRRSAWMFASIGPHTESRAASSSTPSDDAEAASVTIRLEGRGESYLLGIADVFQEYTFMDAAAYRWEDTLSCVTHLQPAALPIVPPHEYSSRFFHYISQNVQ